MGQGEPSFSFKVVERGTRMRGDGGGKNRRVAMANKDLFI